MDKFRPEVPFEVWQMIFSLLPFNDQVNCRIICKDWHDFITTLPEFKAKLCLNLEYCAVSENETPVSTIMNSELEFRSLIVGSEIEFEIFPAFSLFLVKLGETVTHLDISQLFGADPFRIIVDNLSLFKALYYFKVGLLEDWLPKLSNENRKKNIDPIQDGNKINLSVNILSVYILEKTDINDFEQIFTLVPNVKEINTNVDEIDKEFLVILKAHADKITSLKITRKRDVRRLQNLNLTNFKKLRITNNHMEFRYNLVDFCETIDQCIKLFPSITNISAQVFNTLPHKHLEYLTETNLDLNWAGALQLSDLEACVNLKTLRLCLQSHSQEKKICYSNHQPLTLKSITKLDFSHYHGSYCVECFETLLQSLSNLSEMRYATNDQQIEFDRVFKRGQNLKALTFQNRIQESKKFKPKKEWPEMKLLKSLVLKNIKIENDKDAWDDFGKKLSKLKHLEVNEWSKVSIFDMIGSNMPSLYKVVILDAEDRNHKYQTKAILRNGKKLFVST